MLTDMNIAVVSPIDVIGGAESYSINLAKALSSQTDSVTLFVNSNRKQPNASLKIEKLTVRYLKNHILPIDPGNPVSSSLIRALTNGNFDIIHVHQMYSFFNLFSSLVGRAKRIPTVLTDHGGGWRLAAIPYICANFPHAFSAVSKFSLNNMLRFAPNKQTLSCISYGGVNTYLFHPAGKNSELYQRIFRNDKIILCLGRILPHKGIDVVIRAFRYLPSNTKLLVVGQILDEEYLRYLKVLSNKFCKDRVIFTGSINERELPEYYNICDIFVQGSVNVDYRGQYHRVPELLGLAKLEAMACGKPVVVSTAGGLPEKIVQGENGFIFEQAKDKQLAQHLNMLLSDDLLRTKIGANGLLTIQKDLTWKKVSERNLDFYHFLLKK
jgi:glycosyltransferase involved in cell wall biosynthesis